MLQVHNYHRYITYHPDFLLKLFFTKLSLYLHRFHIQG